MNRRRNKLTRIVVIGFFVLLLLSCESEVGWKSNDGNVITDIMNIPFHNCEEEFVFQDVNDVDVYYLNDGSVPYIDVSAYFNLIDPVSRINVSDFEFEEDSIIIEYHPVLYQYMFFEENISHENNEEVPLRLEIDFTSEEVLVSDYLFFFYQGMPIINLEVDDITIEDVSIKKGVETVIPFGEYGLDFTIQYNKSERLYLVPFHVATLLFTNSTLYRTYYNGDAIYAGGRCIYYEDVRTSSLSGEEIPIDMRKTSFNLFTLALDYFSSIKDARDVESYRDYLTPSYTTINFIPSDNYYTEFTKLLYVVDDIHADLPANGYYAGNPTDEIQTYPAWFSENRTAYWTLFGNYYSTLINTYNNRDSFPTVRLLDNETIAVIYLYQFTTTTPEEVEGYLSDLPDTVEQVVLDLTVNAGGNVNALFRVLGFMTDQPITFTNGIASSNSSVTFTISTSEEVYDYEWYIKTSSLTYSAGNILALIAKENDLATIIGNKSMGGASVIESILLPCGFSHTISGNYTFYSVDGTAEFGVPVDIKMEDIWSDNELVTTLKAHKN